MSRPTRAWPTPRFQWVSWTHTSTTPSLWRHIVACHCSPVRQRHGLICHHPPTLWLHLCTTQVSEAFMSQWSDVICAAVMRFYLQSSDSDMNFSDFISWKQSHIFHTFGVFHIPKILKGSWLSVLRSPKDYLNETGWEVGHQLVPFLGHIPPTTDPTSALPLWTYLPQEGASLSFALLLCVEMKVICIILH